MDRSEGRSVVFTEQLYGFKVPSRGQVLDYVVLEDNSVHVVVTDPISLCSIDPSHRFYNILDLYEYFPLIGPGFSFFSLFFYFLAKK